MYVTHRFCHAEEFGLYPICVWQSRKKTELVWGVMMECYVSAITQVYLEWVGMNVGWSGERLRAQSWDTTLGMKKRGWTCEIWIWNLEKAPPLEIKQKDYVVGIWRHKVNKIIRICGKARKKAKERSLALDAGRGRRGKRGKARKQRLGQERFRGLQEEEAWGKAGGSAVHRHWGSH